MTLSNPTHSAIDSTAHTGIWASFAATIRRWLAPVPVPSLAGEAAPEETADDASVVVTPSGYRIRVPRPDDVHRSVGEILPSVREGLELVPPLPQAVVELLKEIQNPTASAASVANIAASDPAMAASLIRAVNAAAMGMHRKITSVSEAVSYLGLSSVKSLLLRLKLDQNLSVKTAASDDVNDLWIHSLMVSYIAETLARRVRGVDAGFVSTLGLLHDIGKLVIHSRFPAEAKAIHEATAVRRDESLLDTEARILGADHAALGAQLAAKWQLPADLVKAIRWHHFPERAFEPGDPKALHQAVQLVQIANQLAKYCYTYSDGMEFELLSARALEAVGFGPQLPLLLDTDVCAAASRAIFFADESVKQSSASTRRFLRLHRGEDAKRFLSSLDSSPTGTRQVDVNNDLCASLFDPAGGVRPLTGTATADGARKLLSDVESRFESDKIAAGDRLALSLVTRCILASLNGSGDEPINVSLSKEGRRAQIAYRSAALSFVSRFGAGCDADAALLALELELANVLNLNWFDSVVSSSDGCTLTFTTQAA